MLLRTVIAAAVLEWGGSLPAQEEQARPTFEVASVKPAEPGRRGPGPLRGGPGTNSPGELSGASTLKNLLMRAYGLKSYQVIGPSWMESARYEIAAKVPPGTSAEKMAWMLQSLLADRFGLVAHRETRELPIFEMVTGKSGPKLKRSPAADAKSADIPKLTTGPDGFPEMAPGANAGRSFEVVTGGTDGILYKLWARHETMQQLADRLSSQLNRAVVDRTGIEGEYDFTLEWTMEAAGGTVPRTDPPPDEIDMHNSPVMSDPGLSIFRAIQTQLGLKLEAKRGPLEMLIVDQVDKTPTGN